MQDRAESISCLVYKILENSDKCQLVFPKTQNDIRNCLLLSTTQRYSVHCQRGEFGLFFFKKTKNKKDGSQPLKLSHYFVLFCLLLKVTWCLLYLLF